MALIKVRAKDCPANVLEVDKTNADTLISRGTWEIVPDKEEVTDSGNGRKPAGRRRSPGASTAT